MNIAELKTRLEILNIPKIAYSFTTDGFGEVYRISPIHDILGPGWEVYYSERGNKNKLIIFRSEAEACEYFYNWILGDSTIRKFIEQSNFVPHQDKLT